MDIRRFTTLDNFPRGWLNHLYTCYYVLFKIQVPLHIKRNETSQVVMLVDGVEVLHHKCLLLRADIYDHCLRGVKLLT